MRSGWMVLTALLAGGVLPGAVRAAEDAHAVAADGAGGAGGNDSSGIFQLQFLIGTWQCEGTDFDLVTGASTPVKAQWEVKYSCANHWVTETYTTEVGGSHYTLWGWYTYDPDTRNLVRDVTDSLGNWGHVESGGWADGMLSWRGTAKSPADVAIDLRSTITQQAVNRLWIADMQRIHTHPRWYDTMKVQCRRVVTPGSRPLVD